MNEMTVGLLKKNFSKVLEDVKTARNTQCFTDGAQSQSQKIIPIREKKRRDVRRLGDTLKFTEADDSKFGEYSRDGLRLVW